ncbi:MAG: serine/threonine-protein phosphatase [Chlorobi bacterium]|nr:serine/threonine-protein phosphatase [Chlorobiota bacterium]
MDIRTAFFTHPGEIRPYNQDALLCGGLVSVFGSGGHHPEPEELFAFVADGVAGSPAGEFASSFVLSRLAALEKEVRREPQDTLFRINVELLEAAQKAGHLGSATTLSGFFLREFRPVILHAGDSEVWLWREGVFRKLTPPQVWDPAIPNSPIVSFFGGDGMYLDPFIVEQDEPVRSGDVWLVCTDGLMKVFEPFEAASLIADHREEPLRLRDILLKIVLARTAPDNVSAIVAAVF